MIFILKPILLAFAKSDSVKRLLVDILNKQVSTTHNTEDDKAVEFIEQQLFPKTK